MHFSNLVKLWIHKIKSICSIMKINILAFTYTIEEPPASRSRTPLKLCDVFLNVEIWRKLQY